VTPIGWRDPVMLFAWVRQALGKACATHGQRYRVMTSGAGHDAALVAMNAPAGMLFVATPNGLSHVPDEECRMTDVGVACHVLREAMITLDAQIDSLPDDSSQSESA
jgi:acetylornithine deacetylase/succinyl-diaminopimelate desuccinylase-like protein